MHCTGIAQVVRWHCAGSLLTMRRLSARGAHRIVGAGSQGYPQAAQADRTAASEGSAPGQGCIAPACSEGVAHRSAARSQAQVVDSAHLAGRGGPAEDAPSSAILQGANPAAARASTGERSVALSSDCQADEFARGQSSALGAVLALHGDLETRRCRAVRRHQICRFSTSRASRSKWRRSSVEVST